MKSARILTILVLALGLMVSQANVGEAAPMGTAITYQGHLYDANHVADGLYDFSFRLYDAYVGGSKCANDVNVGDVNVIDGYLTAVVDFCEPNVFIGEALWLEVGVRPGNLHDPNIYTTLSPRQELTPAPLAHYGRYSYHAQWANAARSLDAADGSPTEAVYVDNDGDVGIGTTSPSCPLHVKLSGTGVTDGVRLETSQATNEDWYIYMPSTDNLVFRNDGLNCVTFEKDTGSVGIGTTNPGVKLDIVGEFRSKTTGGDSLVRIGPVITSDTGAVYTYGANGNSNVSLSWLSGYKNNGYVAVYDSSGNVQVRIYVDSSGDGVVSADTKSFRMPNPAEAGTEIWYASVEGPEAAAYIRGTGHLVSGRAVVDLPEHFNNVASPDGMTVQVTPLSAESKGLAVVKKDPSELIVEELSNGNGTYDFDYLVMAVRKGYENYQVIRPALESTIQRPGKGKEFEL